VHASHEPRLLSPAFAWLVGGQLLQSVGYATLPLLPVYLTFLGANRVHIGGLMAAAAVGGLLFRPLTGWALDRVGRVPTVLVGTVLMALATVTAGLMTTLGPLWWVNRVVFGVGMGCLFTGYFTMAGDLVPPTRRTEGLALFGVAGLLPLVVNPLSTELGWTGAMLGRLFVTGGGLIALSAFCVWPLRRLGRPAHGGAEAVDQQADAGWWRSLTARPLWSVWLATMLLSAMVAVFLSFATVAAQSRGVPRATWMWFAYAAGAIGVRLLGARVPDRVGTHNMVMPSVACYVLALVWMAGASTWGSVLLAAGMAGLGHGYCFPVLMSQVVSRVRGSRRGMGVSVFTGLWDVSLLVWTPLLGWLADRQGDGMMFSTLAVGVVVAMGGWVALEHGGLRARTVG
jgi:MFS family permease